MLVCTGALTGNGLTNTFEIIDLLSSSPTTTCDPPNNFPQSRQNGFPFLVFDVPMVCGGVTAQNVVHQTCFSLTNPTGPWMGTSGTMDTGVNDVGFGVYPGTNDLFVTGNK